jgi:hypothetical protein
MGFASFGQMLVVDPDGRYVAVATSPKLYDSPNGFVFLDLGRAPLSIGNLSPATGQSGDLITVRGSGFSSDTQVSINGQSALCNYIDPSTITVVLPPHAPGPAALTVTESGQSYTLDAALNYQ